MNEKYEPNGMPLSEYEREILIILMEECAEVIQAASKLVRFGRENRPDSGKSNSEIISMEIGDLRYMLTCVRDLNLSNAEIEIAASARKHYRILWFMQSTRTA